MAHESHCAGGSYDTVRDALQSARCLIRPRGAQALMASCPLHTDHTPSLSVTWRPSTPGGRCGAVLLHCFSCRADAADLAAALGLRVADLFDAPLPAPTPKRCTVPGPHAGDQLPPGSHRGRSPHGSPPTTTRPVTNGDACGSTPTPI